MTVSKFERGEKPPRHLLILQSLSRAAESVGMVVEAEQFTAACKEALSIEAVNRMYPGVKREEFTMRFETLREWKAMAAALFSERYRSELAPVRSIVDKVVRDADTSRGTGPEWYYELEARVKALMEEREQKRTTTTDDREKY
jgi:hypothetical protein